MANGDKTDPLARYTATGSRSSSIPANPYKASGQNAYWNGQRWVPFNDPSTLPTVAKQQDKLPNLGFFQTAKQAAGAVAGGLGTFARLPFSREAQTQYGTMVGNAISQIPGVTRAVEPLGGGFEQALRAGSGAVQGFTGVGNLSEIEGNVRAGQYSQALENAFLGGAALVGTGRVLTPVRTLSRFAQAGPVGKIFQTVGALTYPGAVTSGMSTGSQPAQAAGGQPSAQTRVSPDRYEELLRRQQAQQSMDYLRTPQYVSTPYGASIKQTFTDAEGRVHTWNPRSNMYEVTGTVAAGTAGAGMNLGLTAAQQLEFENRLRDIEEETRAVLSGLGGQTSAARAEAQEGREASRRRVAGSSQDIASGLAFLGMDTSPGVADVAQEYQARAGAEREAAIAKSLAQTISDISSRRAEALRAQEREKRELAAARRQLEEENILKKQEEEFLKMILGGGR